MLGIKLKALLGKRSAAEQHPQGLLDIVTNFEKGYNFKISKEQIRYSACS